MAKKQTMRCALCGAEDCSATPVVEVVPGLTLCTDCIEYIDKMRDQELAARVFNTPAPLAGK